LIKNLILNELALETPDPEEEPLREDKLPAKRRPEIPAEPDKNPPKEEELSAPPFEFEPLPLDPDPLHPNLLPRADMGSKFELNRA